MIERAFLFDSLIDKFDVYTNLAKKYENYDDQLKAFKKIREEAVDAELAKNISLYKDIIGNILLTNVGKNTLEKLEISKKYFVRNFYDLPVYYGFHLLHFNFQNFVKESVEFVNEEIYFKNVNKYGSVILNPMRNDLFQMLADYISLMDKKSILSLYGLETTLREVKKINKLYTPNVDRVEYNYLSSVNGMPYPLKLRKGIEDIESGKIVLILPELSVGLGPKYSTQLLGQEILMPMGSSWLSSKEQVPIILVHTEMLQGYKIKITFEDPIYPSLKASRENIFKQSKLVFKKIDNIIRNNPYSWCGYDTFDKIIVKRK